MNSKKEVWHNKERLAVFAGAFSIKNDCDQDIPYKSNCLLGMQGLRNGEYPRIHYDVKGMD